MAKPYKTVNEEAFAVGAAVGNGVGHFPENYRRYRLAVKVKYASNTTHD